MKNILRSRPRTIANWPTSGGWGNKKCFFRPTAVNRLRWKSNFESIRFDIFTERGNTFTRLECRWESVPNVGCSNRESMLGQVQFNSGNIALRYSMLCGVRNPRHRTAL